jgi:hypothetical protein
MAGLRVKALTDSVDPLREWFNANRDRVRLVALASPT